MVSPGTLLPEQGSADPLQDIGDAGVMATGRDGDEAVPDGILELEALPLVEDDAGRIDEAADQHKSTRDGPLLS